MTYLFLFFFHICQHRVCISWLRFTRSLVIDLHNLSSLRLLVSSSFSQFSIFPKFPLLTPFITMIFKFCSFSTFLDSPTFGPFIHHDVLELTVQQVPCMDNNESFVMCSSMCLSFVTTLISLTSMYFSCLFLCKVFTLALLQIVDHLLSTMTTVHFSPI